MQKGELLFVEEPIVVGPSREKKLVMAIESCKNDSKENIRSVSSALCRC